VLLENLRHRVQAQGKKSVRDFLPVGNGTINSHAQDRVRELRSEKATTADVGGEIMTITMPSATIHKVVFLGAPGVNDGVGLDNVTFGPVVPVSH